MRKEMTKPRQIQKAAALFIMVTGLALLGYMVTIEGEPGAVPLLMLTVGAAWCLLIRRQQRRVVSTTDPTLPDRRRD